MDVSKDLAKLKDVVSPLAPLLGAVLGGSHYNFAVGLLSQLLGANGLVSDVLAKISSDKDVSSRLKSLEDQHCEALEKLANEAFAQEVGDRQDARKMQKELHGFVPTVLALGFLLIFAVVLFYVLIKPTADNHAILDKLLPGLIYILAYFFGGIHKKGDEPNG